MIISTTDVQNSFGKYLKIVACEDVIITKNGKKIARLIKYTEELNDVIREGYGAYSHQGMKVTYEEFLKICEGSENRYEYIDGEIYRLASPVYKHQKAVREILFEFSNWFKDKECEPLDSPFDVTLKTDSINVVQPDLLVICDTENINDKGKYFGIPTLVVEILSESTRGKDYVTKLNLYMKSGIKEYWIVNPFDNEICIYVFDKNDILKMTTFKGNDIAESQVFKGLKIKLEQVFE